MVSVRQRLRRPPQNGLFEIVYYAWVVPYRVIYMIENIVAIPALVPTIESDHAKAIIFAARQWADSLGVPVAYLYADNADNADLAEVILAFGLLPEPEQRRLAVELRARVSPPATRTRPACKARATPRTR